MVSDSNSKLYQITSLPDVKNFDGKRQFSGYIKADNQTSLFFWLVKPASVTQTVQDLVIWLNGGPGCSSMDGNMMELGAYRFDWNDGKLKENPYSWSVRPNVHLLYIDQPGSTGFSVSSNENMPTTTAIENFASFYQNFLAIFDEYASNTRLFITGER